MLADRRSAIALRDESYHEDFTASKIWGVRRTPAPLHDPFTQWLAGGVETWHNTLTYRKLVREP